MTLKRDCSKSGKWDKYGGSNKISTAKNIAAVLHMQEQRSHAEVFKREIGAGRTLAVVIFFG